MLKVNHQKDFFLGYLPFVSRFLIIIFILLLSPSQPISVFADSSYLFHPGYGTPVIDGNVDATEWSDADTYTQVMYASTLTGTLYVLQDNTNLYLGFVIDDDELTTGSWYGMLGDTLEISFDDDNSGALYEIDENKIVIDPVTPYKDKHFTNDTGSSGDDILQPGGQTNGQGFVTRQGDDNHFELSFPLCSGDTYDFCLSAGIVLGLQLHYSDFDANTAEPSPTPFSSFLPGIEPTELVTIEIQDFSYSVFLPLICR
jgi:hypothetical protein